MKDTKEIILKTAYDMFMCNNYEAVTINGVIKATGLTKGAIYHYYDSKESLFKAVVDKYMVENHVDSSDENLSLGELIESTIEHIRFHIKHLVVENPKYHEEVPINYLSLMVAAYRYYPDYAKIGNTFYQSLKEKWVKTLTNAIDCKEIRNDIDVDAIIILFLQIGPGIATHMILGESVDYALEICERQYRELYKNIKTNNQ